MFEQFCKDWDADRFGEPKRVIDYRGTYILKRVYKLPSRVLTPKQAEVIRRVLSKPIHKD